MTPVERVLHRFLLVFAALLLLYDVTNRASFDNIRVGDFLCRSVTVFLVHQPPETMGTTSGDATSLCLTSSDLHVRYIKGDACWRQLQIPAGTLLPNER